MKSIIKAVYGIGRINQKKSNLSDMQSGVAQHVNEISRHNSHMSGKMVTCFDAESESSPSLRVRRV
eukprot:scaffold22888_cov37-Prasinocladus_malaysianus.AAC.1